MIANKKQSTKEAAIQAAEQLAYMHVWDCIVGILESGAEPRGSITSSHAVNRVIKIAQKEMQRHLEMYDRFIDKVDNHE